MTTSPRENTSRCTAEWGSAEPRWSAAGVLLRAGVAAGEVWPLISEARGLPVPDTVAQRHWVEALATTLDRTDQDSGAS